MDNLKIKGTYHFVHKDINGNIKDEWSVDNLITNAGLAQLALLAGDASAVPFTYIAVGTSNTAPGAAQTTLVAEITDTGFTRHSATFSRVQTTVANDTLQLVYSFGATGNKTIEEVGIFNDATVGTMLSRALTGSKSFSNGENFEITYKLKIS